MAGRFSNIEAGLARGQPLSTEKGKEGGNVRTIIKLLEVITNLVRAITDLIREFKA